MLLEDLAALLARDGAHPDALLQLDYKEDAAALDAPRRSPISRKALGPVARHFILSSGDAESVRVLTDSAPGVRIGYDPCHKGAHGAADGDARLCRRSSRTRSRRRRSRSSIYLEYRLVLEAEQDGFDLIGAFHAHGRRIDAYTVQRGRTTRAWR